ncbi:MAG: hypothetical protein KDJ65_23705 [Anaerolineae bacterium]|nr:hypothetical protein [Anaerolineae bacterium]
MSDSDKKKPSENDIESPVDGPTPDWMKMATSSNSAPSLTEENTPDWLKDIRSGKSSAGSDTSTETSDETSSEMSDLERLLAEEGIDLGTVAEERPEGSEGMSARDWMISTSDDELIRRRIGGDDITTEEPAPAVAVSEPVAETPSESSGEMSDLERLLAEEGIDLGTVAEDRPEGSEGMSARDWMISTSDDELIRRRIGGDDVTTEEPAPAPTPAAVTPEPQPEPAVPTPAAETEIDDDKMVVEEDLPDWLREIDEDDDSGFGEIPTFDNDDKLVDEEGLPDWLQDIEESDDTELAIDTTAGTASEESGTADDEMPDWLGGFGETVESPASTVSSSDLSGEEDDKMVVEEDLPDWLREVDDEPEAASDTATTPSDDDGMVVEEDLPGWLSDLSDEDADSDFDAEQGDDTLVSDELPDWLSDTEDPEDVPFQLDTSLAASPLDSDDEDLPDWLREVQEDVPTKESTQEAAPASQAAAPVATRNDPDVIEEDLPDWLREVQEDSDIEESPLLVDETATTASAEPVTVDDDGLPDWLKDVDDTTEDISVEAPVTAAVQADENDLPDWLKEVGDDDESFEDISFSSEEDTLIVEEDLPDWLSEVDTESDDPFEPSEPSPEEEAEIVAMDELPDWLRDTDEESLDDIDEDELASLPPAEAVSEPLEEGAMPVEDDDLPDWLKEGAGLESLSEDGESEEIAAPEPSPEPVAASSPIEEAFTEPVVEADEAEPLPVAQTQASPPTRIASRMPDWLKKLRESQPKSPVKQPVVAEASAVVSSSMQTAGAIGAPAKFDSSVLQNLPHDTGKRLELARDARERGEIDEAIPIYSNLVSSGAHLTSVIEDLQQSLKTYPTNYMLYQVIGDAMLKDGRIQNALESYRQALTKLTG